MEQVYRRKLLALLGSAAVTGPAFAGPAISSNIDIVTANGRVSQVTRWFAADKRGTILFSHGALSSPWKYAPLILPWVAAGFDVWAPLHVDSTDYPAAKSFTGFSSWPARIEDMRALASYVNAPSWVAAGHSYGALVALTLGGATPARPPGITGPLAEPGVSCAVAFSPPGTGMGLVTEAGYATLAVPALIETGTKDMFNSSNPDAWHTHLTAYEAAAPVGDRYALVLEGVNHYFGGLICNFAIPGPRQKAQMKKAVAYSKLFLDGYATGNAGAREKLNAEALSGPPNSPGLYRR
jgi:pimeloyl-ACP methyl ester carboxylesterase